MSFDSFASSLVQQIEWDAGIDSASILQMVSCQIMISAEHGKSKDEYIIGKRRESILARNILSLLAC